MEAKKAFISTRMMARGQMTGQKAGSESGFRTDGGLAAGLVSVAMTIPLLARCGNSRAADDPDTGIIYSIPSPVLVKKSRSI
jgi:hypothetical protein